MSRLIDPKTQVKTDRLQMKNFIGKKSYWKHYFKITSMKMDFHEILSLAIALDQNTLSIGYYEINYIFPSLNRQGYLFPGISNSLS